ncbi:enoyl-CoA hydratase [Croceicoccus estronivorus]|uniref:enoyl-CoA hydratase/isomerase family protein n=1 Tax=Croceicoccus estronivorus TaxID=1172626 RepID=UPI00082D8097|nr:enoyl-CoA hydratase/isomerase family protein [Croceicoccus estronivorus]OCC22963.1 enoyl-CoA hydratase [Croceicoccus estronivorus]
MTFGHYTTMRVARSGRIATVTLNRPEQLNAANATMHGELARIFNDLAHDPDSDVIVLTGAGRAFCAGGDVEWMQSMVDDPRTSLPLVEETKAIVISLLSLPKPVVCRMNGDAIGLGATLALGCDMIVAAEGARFGDPHVRMGLAAGDGAALILPQLIGYMRARELLLTGDLLDVREGQAMGLINHVVPAAELDDKVQKLTQKLARGAQQATRYTKVAINAGLRRIAAEQADMLIAYELLTMRSADHAEAVAAMRDGRRPQFGQDRPGVTPADEPAASGYPSSSPD